MHHALFRAHWEGTGRLENVDDLVRIGTEIGLDPAELRTAIEEGRFEAVLDDNRHQAESVGINAIPAHIFGRRYLVLGAHPYESFMQVIDRLRDEEESEGESSEG
jgi:predicted DsbA family dithiol-disulfide isomerase